MSKPDDVATEVIDQGTYQSRDIVSALKKNGSDVSFCEIEAQWGHDAFLVPNKRLDGLISGFLDRVYHEHCL